MKRIFVLLIAAAALAAGALAGERWLFLGTSEQETLLHYLDSKTVQYRSSAKEPGCNCYALVWDKILQVNDDGRLLVRYEIHRTSRSFRPVAVVMYDQSGKLVNSTDMPDSKWSSIPPGSVVEVFLEAVFPETDNKAPTEETPRRRSSV